MKFDMDSFDPRRFTSVLSNIFIIYRDHLVHAYNKLEKLPLYRKKKPTVA